MESAIRSEYHWRKDQEHLGWNHLHGSTHIWHILAVGRWAHRPGRRAWGLFPFSISFLLWCFQNFALMFTNLWVGAQKLLLQRVQTIPVLYDYQTITELFSDRFPSLNYMQIIISIFRLISVNVCNQNASAKLNQWPLSSERGQSNHCLLSLSKSRSRFPHNGLPHP